MKRPHPAQRPDRSAAVSLRMLGSICLAAACLLVPWWLRAAAPDWWETRGVVSASPANDYAAVNQGQVKNLAKAAAAELDAHLPGGAGTAIHQLLASWSAPSSTRNDFSAINLGQLKNLAKPFYDQFIARRYTDRYPWFGSALPANDYALANIGQVKNLFAFDLSQPGAGLDLDHNGLPDGWEIQCFGHTGVDPNADEDGDGLTNLQEYHFGIDPIDPLNSNASFAHDSDHNGIADWWEVLNFGHIGNDPNQVIAGKGGLTLKQIFDHGLDLVASSTVGDSIPDAWKIQHYLGPLNPSVANEDPDGDRLTNADEYAAGADPLNWDTDGDYIADGQDTAPLVANPVDPQDVRIDVPSYDALSQQPDFDPSQVDYTAIQMQWRPADYGGTATGYRIEKRVDSNPWKELATVGAGTTSQADQGLIASRQYQYRVIALVDRGSAHVESNGAIAHYQVPLGLRLAVRPTSHYGSKSDWATHEFTNYTLPSSTPPNYYLVTANISTLAGSSSSSGGANSSSSATWGGHYSYIETAIPSQHTRNYVGSYSYNSQNNSSDSGGSYASGNDESSGYHWTDQSRYKGNATAVHQGDGNYQYSSSSGPNKANSSGSRWDGTYLSNEAYHAESGQPVWTGRDFDLSHGHLTYAGSSTYKSSGSDGSSLTENATESTGANGNASWTGTGTRIYSNGTTYNFSLSSAPYYRHWTANSWYGSLIDAQHTQYTYHEHSNSGSYHSNSDATKVLSQLYDTPAFVTDVIRDLPDYPADWDKSSYRWVSWGWDGYSFWGGWYHYTYPWYGWWVAERHLHKDKDELSISKTKYKFKVNPSAPTTINWCEVFVPDDDPTTPDVDESKDIRIVAERTWALGTGQTECPEYEIDPSIRDDGNGHYILMIEPVHLSTAEVGEASKDVSGQETDPGKVILINDADRDGDGIPDYGDGYRLHNNIDLEAHSYSASFTPIYVNFTDADLPHAKIKFTYDASDPLGVTRSGSDFYVLPSSGKLRIWSKDGWAERDGHDANAGGDFIKPGVEYSLQDLGVERNHYGGGRMTFYVEAVKTSGSVADLPVKVEIDPTGNLGYVWSDQLRFTTTKVELVGKNLGNSQFEPLTTLIASNVSDFDRSMQQFGYTPASFEVHRFRVYDPRLSVIDHISVGATKVALLQKDGHLETDDFIYLRAGQGVVSAQLPRQIVPIAATPLIIFYNPAFDWIDNILGINQAPDVVKQVQDYVRDVSNDLYNQRWTPLTDGLSAIDSGAFGKAIHRRSSAYFSGIADFYTDVYVNTETRIILSVGRELPINEIPANSTQIDLLHVKKGYHLTGGIGQILNKEGILHAFDIKTAARISATEEDFVDQYRRLTLLLGEERIYFPTAPHRFNFKLGVMTVNTRWARGRQILKLGGAAAAVLAVVPNLLDSEKQLDKTIHSVLLYRNALVNHESDAQVFKNMAFFEMTEYIKLICPVDGADGLLVGASAIWVMTDEVWQYDEELDIN